jgi:hypothetical protein
MEHFEAMHIKPETKKRLRVLKAEAGLTYDEVIDMLMSNTNFEKNEEKKKKHDFWPKM